MTPKNSPSHRNTAMISGFRSYFKSVFLIICVVLCLFTGFSLLTSDSTKVLRSSPLPAPSSSSALTSGGNDADARGLSPHASGCDDSIRVLEDHSHDEDGLPNVLILTPVKNAQAHLERYFKNLYHLSYPHNKISLGLMDSDSDDKPTVKTKEAFQKVAASVGFEAAVDEPAVSAEAEGKHGHNFRHTGTFYAMVAELPKLKQTFRSVTVFQHNFGLKLRGDRHQEAFQLARRRMLAMSRNHLLISTLRDEDWVMWLDSDLESYPADLIQSLLSPRKQIVVPNCVMEKGGRSYDLNSWRVRDSKLGNNATLEEVLQWHDRVHQARVEGGSPHKLDLEGYGETKNVYLHHLRGEGEVVRLDAVGGAVLLVDAELHRHGLMFPAYVHRHRIETEGLSMMALDMGVLSWGMPNVEVIHK